MSNPQHQISRDAADRLREWSDEYRTALALPDVDPWAEQNGHVRTTDAYKTTFPVPVDQVGYHEFKGDPKFDTLYSRTLSMQTKEYQAGVEAETRMIEAPDFIDWAGKPAQYALEWSRLPNELVAAMLESGSGQGPFLDFYRDSDANIPSARRLFAADHPFNVLDDSVGSWENEVSVTMAEIRSGKAFKRINRKFRSICGPNGKRMGLKLQGGKLLCHSDQENLFDEVLKSDTLIRAVSDLGTPDATADVVSAVVTNNRYRGTIAYQVGDELTTDDVFYALAAPKSGLHAWIVQKQGAPEESVWDKSSEYYRGSGRVKISYKGGMGIAACLPHRIIKVTITDFDADLA